MGRESWSGRDMSFLSLTQLHQGEAFSLDPGEPPLPGGAAEVVRFFMEVPQPIQIGGVIFGAVAAVVLTFLAWKHRVALRDRLRAVPAPVKITALLVIALAGSVASVAGYRVYDFVEHDNRFCTGCHVMADAFVRFDESAHNELGCKDCHAQPKTESARQLLIWVTDRPLEIGPHSPVPNVRCAACHVEQDGDEWPQIAASLGHRVHFDSEDPDLDGLMCVGCHGVTVHEFVPVSATCAECHGSESEIQLGRMGGETELHCVVCHDFLGREGVTLPGTDESVAMLPDQSRCLSCHEMSAFFDEASLDEDPHQAVCGACHNPHSQSESADAVETCVGCHVGPDTLTVFHTGTHAPVLAECTLCHTAHSWQVDGTDCVACHGTVPDDRQSSAPAAVPFLNWGVSTLLSGAEFGAPNQPWAGFALHVPSAQEARPFRHESHVGVSCIECHGRPGEHGVITVQSAQDCAACHHDAGRAYECAACHGPNDIPIERNVTATMALTVWEEPGSRTLPFRHAIHVGVSCGECHSTGVLLTVERGCADCHADHHRPEADCSTCHRPSPEGVHGLESHLTCATSGCHASETVERPALSRTLCLMCHSDQQDHEPGRECQACHMVPESPPVRPGGSVQ